MVGADELKRRAVERRKRMVARVVRRDEDDRSFDIEFWQRLGPEARFEAAWEMVREYWRMQGKDPADLKMKRNVTRRIRRRR